jgi:alcohol dehydrogenase class IV
VPTTAGTGAEATVNAVLHAADQQVKVSMRSPLMLVETVIVDPALALTLPPHVTACAGLDAVTQLLEAFVSTGANPLTDALCRQGLVCAGRSLVRAVNDGADLAARTDMALAALCSGIALANARLGAVHGLAAPLGGLTGAAHGALCGRLLPAVTAVNLRALRRHAPHSPALARYTEAARLFLADADASTDDFTDALWRLCRKLHIPTLRELGITDETRDAAIPAARNASSMKTNPIALTDTDLYDCFHDTATTVASSSGEVAQ